MCIRDSYVLSKSTSITSLADIQTGTSLTNDYIVGVKGRPVLDQVIENLNLNESYKTLGSRVTPVSYTHLDVYKRQTKR